MLMNAWFKQFHEVFTLKVIQIVPGKTEFCRLSTVPENTSFWRMLHKISGPLNIEECK